jgi:hypothetical protein
VIWWVSLPTNFKLLDTAATNLTPSFRYNAFHFSFGDVFKVGSIQMLRGTITEFGRRAEVFLKMCDVDNWMYTIRGG